MSVLHESLLYEAATNSLASDASSENTWTKMVQASFPYGNAWQDFKKEIKEVELQIKKEYALTKMPSPWRSAKSVVISAMKTDIALQNTNGTVVGKTSVQHALKEFKDASSVESVYAKGWKYLKWIQKNLPTDKSERMIIREHCQNIIDEITLK